MKQNKNIFEVKLDDNSYDIEYVIQRGALKDMMMNTESDLFTVHVDAF